MIELKQYFDLQKKIYDYFGYVEDWVVFPIEDSTNCFWYKNGTEVCFSESKDDLLNTEKGNYYIRDFYPRQSIQVKITL